LIASVPPKFKLHPVTRDLFDHCAWQNPLLSLYQPASAYLEQSIGFVLLDGEMTYTRQKNRSRFNRFCRLQKPQHTARI
jgi:hypothetical protein